MELLGGDGGGDLGTPTGPAAALFGSALRVELLVPVLVVVVVLVLVVRVIVLVGGRGDGAIAVGAGAQSSVAAGAVTLL